MEEKTFLAEEGVTVTSARFIVPSQTYAMSGITSVKTSEDTPSKGGPIFCVGGGLFLFYAGSQSSSTDSLLAIFIVLGIAAIIVAIAWLAFQETQHHLVLRTASGEARAFSSRDGALVARVARALNDSIVSRG